MVSLSDLAYARNVHLIGQGNLLGSRVARLWRQIPVNDLTAGFGRVAPQMTAQVVSAQLAAARGSERYQSAVDRHWGVTSAGGQIVPEAFTNVMGDGRQIASALYGAVTHTKTLIGRGVVSGVAFQSGAMYLAMMASSAMHDMARNADRVASVGHGYTSYVRVVNGSACSRCAILAGMYSAEEAFLRHVSCQCGTVAIPRTGKVPEAMSSPEAYFQSLSTVEQNRVFTNAGAEAIRQGADPVAVVNARRGAYGIGYNNRSVSSVGAGNRLIPVQIGVRANGTPLNVYATTEGTTRRGSFYKSERKRVAGVSVQGGYTRTNTLRLLPEQIMKMAGSNPARWTELLRKYGYLY